MADDFDIQYAERVLMDARTALQPGRSSERHTHFPLVVGELDKSLRFIKQNASTRQAAIDAILEELRGMFAAQLNAFMQRHDLLSHAVEELRSAVMLKPNVLGALRWEKRDEQVFHDKLDRLFILHTQQQVDA